MAKVAIILPIYNVEKYLRQCLDSCINQTLKDIEIICVNDGSTDNCLEIINEYAKKDARIKVINQENQGVSIARNNGMDIATGEYILFLDPDDWLEPDCCETAYNQAKENDNDFVYFNHSTYNESTGEFRCPNNLRFVRKLINQKQINLKNIKNINYIKSAFVWNKLYKHSWLIENNLKFVHIRLGEDVLYTVMIYLKSNSMSFIQKPLYVYRTRIDSLSQTANIDSIFHAKNVPINYILENENGKKILKVYLKYYYESLLYWYYSLNITNNKKLKFKNLLIKNFNNLKKYDYRACVYLFFIKSGISYLYSQIIKKIVRYVIRKLNFKNLQGEANG